MNAENKYQTQYQKGFNEGYLIAKHLPKLSEQLGAITNETPRIEGFRDGRKQYAIEKAREHRPAWLKGEAHKAQDKQQDKSKDTKRER